MHCISSYYYYIMIDENRRMNEHFVLEMFGCHAVIRLRVNGLFLRICGPPTDIGLKLLILIQKLCLLSSLANVELKVPIHHKIHPLQG